MKIKLVYPSLFFLATCNFFIVSYARSADTQDSLAIVAIYNGTNGDGWRNHQNWLTSAPISTWHGVTVKDGKVIKITLNKNNLSNSLPPEIGDLKHLKKLDLSQNKLTGNIPKEISGMIKLTQLYLNDNQLSGNIPKGVGNLSKLEFLYIYHNLLTGNIPAEIGNLSNLLQLDLSDNLLNGSIPSTLSKLANLNYLHLGLNQLTGNIPSEIGNLSNMLFLYFNQNQLSGSIPSTFGELTKLNMLYLQNNQLSGTIPSEFINLLGNCYLYDNRFTFDELEPIIDINPIPFKYDPQANIPLQQTINGLSVSAGGTLINNTYRWFKVGQTNSISIIGDSVFIPLQSGKYYAEVSNSICTELTLYTDTVKYTTVAIKSNIASSITNSLPVNGVNSFQVYPNPAKDLLHVKTIKKANFSLIDQSGKTLIKKTINYNGAIDISGIAPGWYYLKNNTNEFVIKVMIHE